VLLEVGCRWYKCKQNIKFKRATAVKSRITGDRSNQYIECRMKRRAFLGSKEGILGK